MQITSSHVGPAPVHPLRILTVARWYPSHDSPGRGSFVADLVAATVAAGVEARVVSFDRVLIRGRVEWRDADRAPARAGYDRVGTPAALFVTPSSYGAPGVPVARLPVVRRPGVGDAEALIGDHLDALRPFVGGLLANWRPDVIHAHTGLPDGIAAAAVGQELGIPVLVSEHASTIEAQLMDPVSLERYRELISPGVRLVGASPSLAGRVAALLGIPADGIDVLPNPVAAGSFPLADPAGRDPNELLWVGSLGEHKGIDVLLEAFALLRARRPELHLRLVGRERARGDLARWEALASTLGVRSVVAFDGWLARDQVASAMAGAGLFVHPSPSETFGVAAAEAILTGLPVAARRSGGVPWIIRLSGGYGSVADGNDAHAFANAIEAVLAGAVHVDAASARSRLVEAIGERAVAGQAIELYEQAIGRDRGVPRPMVEPATVTRSALASTASPAGPPADLPRVLLATGRDQARRLVADLPIELQGRLVLVLPAPIAATDDADDGAVPSIRIVEAEPIPPPRPRPRGRSPMARVRRALFRPAPSGDELLAEAIQSAAQATGLGRGPVEVVAIDAPAAAFIERLGPGRVRLAPGSIRWLADRWDAERGA